MAGKQVTELDALPSFTDTSLLPVHNGTGLKKGLLSQLVSYLGTKFSNPNLLINPDFKINQRGQSTYSTQSKKIYTVDRWHIYNANFNASTKMLTNPNSSSGQFKQDLETSLTGTYTMTVKATSVSGNVYFFVNENGTNIINKSIVTGVNTVTFTSTKGVSNVGILISNGASVQLDYAKVEQSSVATPFVAPNMAEELTKCYRFYQRMKPHYSGYVAKFQKTYFPIPIKAQTRTKGTITVSDQQNSYNITGVSTMWSVSSDDYNKCPYIGFTTDLDGYARLNCIVEIDAEIY